MVIMFSLAKKTDGTLWSWGRNSDGQLGQNNTTYFSSPVQIPGTTWSSISGVVIFH
jgi:alpha-tubulin suppressor-like RCC1 family protein